MFSKNVKISDLLKPGGVRVDQLEKENRYAVAHVVPGDGVPAVVLDSDSLRSEEPFDDTDAYAFVWGTGDDGPHRVSLADILQKENAKAFGIYQLLVAQDEPLGENIRVVRPKLASLKKFAALFNLKRSLTPAVALKNLMESKISKEEIETWAKKFPEEIPWYQIPLITATPPMWFDIDRFLRESDNVDVLRNVHTAEGTRAQSVDKNFTVRLSRELQTQRYKAFDLLRHVAALNELNREKQIAALVPILTEAYSIFDLLRGKPAKADGVEIPVSKDLPEVVSKEVEIAPGTKGNQVYIINYDWSGFVSTRRDPAKGPRVVIMERSPNGVLYKKQMDKTVKFLSTFVTVRVEDDSYVVTYGEARRRVARIGLQSVPISTIPDFIPKPSQADAS